MGVKIRRELDVSTILPGPKVHSLGQVELTPQLLLAIPEYDESSVTITESAEAVPQKDNESLSKLIVTLGFTFISAVS